MNCDASTMTISKVELDQQIYLHDMYHTSEAMPADKQQSIANRSQLGEDNGKYFPLWYTGNRLPSSVPDVTIIDNQENDGDSSVCLDSDEDDGLWCAGANSDAYSTSLERVKYVII
ncbi:hypothetical protein EVAR_51506_1 [Eumeta japonica]|uniref:Uncharacterized protein n=1 Tax=Eumeta variegata TaxID=151549 RepID=A0A4C1XCL7_EUMVA|nr:hypothetical protein EVAR_51506_1 [Eumeta japonica]